MAQTIIQYRLAIDTSSVSDDNNAFHFYSGSYVVCFTMVEGASKGNCRITNATMNSVFLLEMCSSIFQLLSHVYICVYVNCTHETLRWKQKWWLIVEASNWKHCQKGISLKWGVHKNHICGCNIIWCAIYRSVWAIGQCAFHQHLGYAWSLQFVERDREKILHTVDNQSKCKIAVCVARCHPWTQTQNEKSEKEPVAYNHMSVTKVFDFMPFVLMVKDLAMDRVLTWMAGFKLLI